MDITTIITLIANKSMWISILLTTVLIQFFIIYKISNKIYVIKYKIFPFVPFTWVEGNLDENKVIKVLKDEIYILKAEIGVLRKEGRNTSILAIVLLVFVIIIARIKGDKD